MKKSKQDSGIVAFYIGPITSSDSNMSDRDYLSLLFKEVYETVARPLVAKMFGNRYSCIRNDDVIDDSGVFRRISNTIANSGFVIADLVELNPNVLYELGIAHAIGRHSVVLSPHNQSLPSDIASQTEIRKYEFDSAKIVKALRCRKHSGMPHLQKCRVTCSKHSRCTCEIPLRDYVNSYRDALRLGLTCFDAGSLKASIVEESVIGQGRLQIIHRAPKELYDDLIGCLHSHPSNSQLTILHAGIHPYHGQFGTSKHISRLVESIQNLLQNSPVQMQELISLDSHECYRLVKTVAKEFKRAAKKEAIYHIRVVPFGAMEHQICPFVIGEGDAFLASSEQRPGAWQALHVTGTWAVNFARQHFEKLFNSRYAVDLYSNDNAGCNDKARSWEELRREWVKRGYTRLETRC